MVNVLYDMIDAFGAIAAGPTVGQPYLFRINNDQGALARQSIAGASYGLDSVTPGLALTAEYRFRGTAGDRTCEAQFFASNIATGANFKRDNEYG